MVSTFGKVFLCGYLFVWVDHVFGACTPTATYTGLTIQGNNLSQVSGNFSSCCQSCTTTTGCVAYSWTNGTCYLKSDTQPLYISSSYSTGVLSPTSNQTYSLQKSYNGSTFFSNFIFNSNNDSSLGDVNYTTEAQATALNLVSVLPNGQVFIGVDNVTVVPLNATRGRASVRIQSKPSYYSGLFILNLAHMPVGVGTWPAFWSYGPGWPNDGEVDILEGVSGLNHNTITLHTSENCSMTSDPNYFNGTWNHGKNNTIVATDCWVDDPNQVSNQGCGISAPAGTFNTGFNQAGGGVFAMEWVPSKFIRVWNFVNPNIPADISSANPNPSGWGLPNAYFALGTNCSANHFYNNTLVFDTDLCGGWAEAYVANCSTFVRSNPQNYTDAYWLINSLNVYCLPNDPNCVLP